MIEIPTFMPATVKKRKAILEAVVAMIVQKGYTQLDETNPTDLLLIKKLVFQISPEFSKRTIDDYALTAIEIWNAK